MNSFIDFGSLLSPDQWLQYWTMIKQWVLHNILIWENLVQLFVQIGVLLAIRLMGTLFGRRIRSFFEPRVKKFRFHAITYSLFNKLVYHIPLLLSIAILWMTISVFRRFEYPSFLMLLVLSLSNAWLAIQLATSVILDRFWSKLIASGAWAVAALNIVGLLDDAMAVLEKIGFSVGDVSLNLLTITKAAIILMVLFRIFKWASVFLEKKLLNIPELTPSSRVLVSKVVNITLLVLVVMIGLNSVGINLTALAVFSGALGVGVGFGLQKVVGNFISGIILLVDKSIKPGDVIQLEDAYGRVREMGGRCVSVVTRDEKEYLIPNENLISQQVINWSYSNSRVRIKASVGISYGADPHKATELILASVKGIPRVLEKPEPKCLLKGFSDNSVDLQLRFWIGDPRNGVANITSEVLFRVWDTLKENNIEIPFPQRDLHLRSVDQSAASALSTNSQNDVTGTNNLETYSRVKSGKLD
jgi:small-conductance mechanosensitive channel